MNLIPMVYEGKEVRTITEGQDVFWVAKDVASLLGYKDTVNAIKKHCRGVAKHHPISDSLGRTQEVRIIDEPDLYRLIAHSKKALDGNKAAGTRSRKTSIELTKLFKQWRKLSVAK